ncbi:phospholipase D-like domain-containing protein [Phenylobacterium aquaticum]|uniref:phospholipase D-like domain-containing protein n=1 Tax=Phenylobacterium aquaticum TaxID=1763816 RepID=UPI001F5CBAE1|nr:phospholipase D-like domain-containing protein [Phenylobacterium aquaticum]MCI3133130.1 phospholipase D-like domain-containing protein [Phenylobacterium aquaticum]
MSVVRVAVPVLQGRRKFHFDKGTPWSILEHLLLNALAKRDATAEELANSADVPQRAIIEALIRLMRAGWVQMASAGAAVTFQPTREGLIAALADELPNAARRMSRNMTFVVEQVSGGVFRSRELPFQHKYMIDERAKRETIVWMERPGRMLFEETRSLLAALFQDDEKFVAMDSSGDRLAERWSLVTVRDGEIDGLTTRASEPLVKEILRAANAAPENGGPSSLAYHPAAQSGLTPDMNTKVHQTAFLGSDLILGGADHKGVVSAVLRKARHRVIIHSTFISEDRFNDLKEDLRVAHSHGAVIDVLWGQDESTTGVRSTREAVGRIREKLKSEGFERLRVHPFSTNSHCKLLIGDDGSPSRYVGYIGSCNWLSTSFQSFEASVRLRDPVIIADAVDQVAELSRGSNGHWTTLTGEMAALAARLRTLPRPSGGKAQIMLVIGSKHAEEMRSARDEATDRILVASHRFGLAARTAVLTPALAAARDRGISTEIFYGTTSGPVGGSEVAEITLATSQEGITIRPIHDPRLHAKVLAWDTDTVVISSQNWLSADPPDSNPRQEIGIAIRAAGAATQFIDRFNAARVS